MADVVVHNTPGLDNYADAMISVANQNNMWSAEQAQKQMEFQERMSNTSHQREMADLKAAGLNPVLSAQSGATSPSGAMGTFDSGITNALGNIVTKMMDIQADNAKANLELASSVSRSSGSGSGFSGYGYTGAKSVGDFSDPGVQADVADLLMDFSTLNVREILKDVGSFVKGFVGAKTTNQDNKAAVAAGAKVQENRTPSQTGMASPATVQMNLNAAKAVSNVISTVKSNLSNVVNKITGNSSSSPAKKSTTSHSSTTR